MASRIGTGRTALVTGASAGIGQSIARELAREGYDLALAARSKQKLDALAKDLRDEYGVSVSVIRTDLLEDGAAKKLFETCKRRKLQVDVLVNNAGIVEMGLFHEIKPARHRDLVKLNVLALTELTALFVPPMVKREFGRVLNVASVAAFQPVPSLGTYAATKAYVLSLTEALSAELSGTGVTVSALCPGLTDTNMLNDIKGSNQRLDILPSIFVSDVDDVARQGVSAMQKGEVIRVPGLANAMATITTRATPKWLYRAVSGIIARQAL